MCSRLMLSSAAIAASLVMGGAQIVDAAAPLSAQTRTAPEVSLAYFMDRLSLFGGWLKHPKWGDVWQPDAGPNFRPYFYGYWQHTTDYGWLWVSNEPYGEIVYHYGRWIFDPDEGWLWLPSYVWAPSWVVWREGEGDVGWLPMPPGYADFDTGTGIEPYAADSSYGYQSLYGGDFVSNRYFALWTFVEAEDFGRSDRRHYVTDQNRLRDFLRHSEARTAYRIDDNRIVDHSLDSGQIQREPWRGIGVDAAARFLKRGALITSVSEGREIFQRERVGAESSTPPEATPPKPPALGAEAARRALSSLPPHGATPLRPLYPGLRTTPPLSEPLRDIQRRSGTIGTYPRNQGVPHALTAPSLGPTPPVSEPLREIERRSRTIGTHPP
jgi:hypothetical protein